MDKQDAPLLENLEEANVILENPRIVLGMEPLDHNQLFGDDCSANAIAERYDCDVFVNMTGRGYGVRPLAGRIMVLNFPMQDSFDPDKLPTKEQVIQFLAAVHCFHDSKQYWHCQAGINRSSFMLVSYLHIYYGYTVDEAIRLIRQQRHPDCLYNSTFVETLHLWWDTP